MEDLWVFRNRMIHAFSPASFALVHHQPLAHLQRTAEGLIVLNAEDCYGAVRTAALKYFAELEASVVLQQTILKRLNDFGSGGAIAVGPIAFGAQSESLGGDVGQDTISRETL